MQRSAGRGDKGRRAPDREHVSQAPALMAEADGECRRRRRPAVAARTVLDKRLEGVGKVLAILGGEVVFAVV